MTADAVFPTAFPRIETERLVLRELTADDVGALFVIHADPETMRYWNSPPLTDVSEAEVMVTRAQAGFSERVSLRFGVTRRDDDVVIGTCSLFAIDLGSRRAETGYVLAREFWGHGYNHEALTGVLEYAFGELRLNRVEAELDPRNVASVKAVGRLGFVHEGVLRERWIVAGEVSDSLIAGLLNAEWEARSVSDLGSDASRSSGVS